MTVFQNIGHQRGVSIKKLFLEAYTLCHVFNVGKEYVCIVRLHEAIEKEAELAKVGITYLRPLFRVY